MMSFIILAIILFLVLWTWLAYEFRHSGQITVEEELQLDEQLALESYQTQVQ